MAEKENLHAKLASLQRRLATILANPMPFDQEARVSNLRKAIRDVRDRIGQEGIDWRLFGF
jgi:hypothetical protein